MNSSIWTLKGNTNPSQSVPGSNDNKSVLHIPQSSRIGALPLEVILCHTQHVCWSVFVMFSYVPNADFKQSHNATVHAVGFSCVCNVGLIAVVIPPFTCTEIEKESETPTSTHLVFTTPIFPLIKMSQLYEISSFKHTCQALCKCWLDKQDKACIWHSVSHCYICYSLTLLQRCSQHILKP